MLHFFRFLFSKAFLINLVIAVLLLSGGIYATLRYLDDYTLHGKTVNVPNLVNLHLSQVEDSLQAEDNFSTLISDSIYVKGKKGGIILEQNPSSKTTVKRGRKIYLTVSSSEPPKISMPKLEDMSLRQATSLLETFGLKLGELIYKPNFCKGCVLEQQIDGVEVEVGERVEKETAIDLVIGQGLGDELTAVPYLIEISGEQAEELLKSKALNLGSMLFDETVLTAEDSVKAIIYRQEPFFSEEPAVRMGSAVDIFLTLDTNRIVHTFTPSDTL